MDPNLPTGERQPLLADLEALELDEMELRVRIARQEPAFAVLNLPQYATLPELQQTLDADQALILALASPLRAGSSDKGFGQRYRALSITSAGVTVVELPDQNRLGREIDLFLALLDLRDGSESDGAVRLGNDVIGPIIRSLPREIRKIVLIPDGVLHSLPIGALIDPGTDEPLATRFEISLAPSATAWVRWKRQREGEPALNVLAIADPAVAATADADPVRGAGLFAETPRLGPLPNAKKEVRVMLRALGGRGRLLIGSRATEAALKQEDLAGFQVLHLAAHALVDDRHPERSAVILAPAPPGEDGLLQFREILDLDLDGPLVLLSACRSGAGPVIGGEGVMGLANAFFRAGARTVVAGLWTLRDDEVSILVQELGRNLGRGHSVGSALTEARRTLIRRGAPPAAWAGLVVLGDADLVPLPGGRKARLDPAQLAAGAAMVLFLLGVVFLGWRRVRARRHPRGID
jgi:CHAT domain-containing protein